MPGPLVAGVDCSTQATKVLVTDPDDGAVVASGRAPHRVSGADGARQTDPDDWWEALGTALAATGRARDVGALSVAGQQHGLVVVDGDGRPLRPAVLWNDTRSADDAAALRGELGGPQGWAERVGVVPVASFTVTTWAWLRRTEPAVAGAAAAVHLPHDHMTARLTGTAATDRGDASGTGWWSTAAEEYLDEVLELDRVRLDRALLPRVLGPSETAGEVRADAAAALGLSAGTLVGPGTGDNMAAALGLALQPGRAALSLGTSGTVYAVAPRRVADPSGVVAGFADATGAFLPLACTLNATQAVDRVASWLGLDRDAVEDGGEVVVLPYLDGERTPDLPEAAGTITGLRHDTTAGQVLRAAYEGVVVSLLDALERVAEHAGGLAAGAPLVLIGGGARGRVWRETVSRLSGRTIELPATEDGSGRPGGEDMVTLGAAAQAAAALRGDGPLEVATRWASARGSQVLPARRLDAAALERNRRVRAATDALNRRG
ncbi:MAG: xylulokinase [Euzebyales bacterium]|nr:xylulokinase [Euzebyales bacterium]